MELSYRSLPVALQGLVTLPSTLIPFEGNQTKDGVTNDMHRHVIHGGCSTQTELGKLASGFKSGARWLPIESRHGGRTRIQSSFLLVHVGKAKLLSYSRGPPRQNGRARQAPRL